MRSSFLVNMQKANGCAQKQNSSAVDRALNFTKTTFDKYCLIDKARPGFRYAIRIIASIAKKHFQWNYETLK